MLENRHELLKNEDRQGEDTMDSILDEYIYATNTHDFKEVAKLLHPNAIFFFSDQTCDTLEKIEQYFNGSWNYINDEVYAAKDVTWLTKDNNSASCMYTYQYSGYVDGEFISGSGRATNVFVLLDGEWKLIHEHLSTVKNP